MAFFNNFPEIKMCGSHFNCNVSSLGSYLVPVCLLLNNQSIILPLLTILSCNLTLCLILLKFQCSHNPLWKSVIHGDILIMYQNLEDLTETPKGNINYASLSLYQKSVSSVTEHFWIFILKMWKIRSSPSQKWRIHTYLSHLWNIRTNSWQVWQIRSNFSHLWQVRLTFTFERICHTCE